MTENHQKLKLTDRAEVMLANGILATEHDLRDLITEMIEQRGSQKAVAEDLGVSQAYLGEVLRGTRSIGSKIVEKLGWEKIVVFKRG